MESAYSIAEQDKNRPRGQQDPSKYNGRVGSNYLQWGEQQGYVYNPWTDEYYIDPKAYSQYQEDVGITEPTPGLLETLAPIAGAQLVSSGAQALGSQLPGLFGLGSGGAATAGAGTAATTGAGVAGATTGATAGAANVAASTGAGTAASGGASAASGGLLGIGALPALGIAGGALLTAKGAKDLINGKETKGAEGWGGRGSLALATGGLSEIARLAGFFGAPKTEVEDNKLQELKDKGILGQGYQINKESRSRADQVKDLESKGQNVPVFLRTGNVSDLTANDIQGYASLLERNPNDLNARLKDATDALAAGAVSEGKGSIGVDWSKVDAYRQALQPAKQYSFEPNSPEYLALSNEDKDKYWRARNG